MKTKTVWLTLSVGIVLSLLLGLFACAAPSAPAPSPSPTAAPSPVASPKAASAATTAPPSAATKPLEVKEWRLGTGAQGSSGFVSATAVARVVNQNAKSVRLMVVPAQSSTENHYMYDRGELEGVLVSSLQMIEYFSDSGSYAKQPLKNKTPIGLGTFAICGFMVTKATNTSLQTYADLVGKSLAPGLTGSMNYLTAKAILTKLGYWSKISDRQMALLDIGSALNMGAVDATFGYISGGVKPDFLQNIDTTMKIRTFNPSAEEKKLLTGIPGYMPMEIPTTFFAQDVGSKTVYTLSYLMGWNFGPREDIERVYEVTKIMFEHAKELGGLYPGLADFARDPWAMEIGHIDSLPGIPVHPGVAKYIKEQGKWKDSWKVAELPKS